MACRILDINLDSEYYLVIAEKQGFGSGDVNEADIQVIEVE